MISAYQQLATHLPIAVAMFDDKLRYIFANDAWQRDFNLSDIELIGQSHYDIFPEIRNDWKEIHQHCLRGNVHTDEEIKFQRIDGSFDWLHREIRPWYQDDGAVGGLIMYITIITEQKHARDELQAERWFLRQVVDLNTSFIFAKDIEGRYTLINKALADWYGSSPEDMVGKYDENYNKKQQETEAFRRDDLQVVRTRTPKFIPEEPVTSAEGETRWYQTIKVPLIFDDDTVQLLGIATDITDRKIAQDNIESQHKFLQQVIDLNTNLIFTKDTNGKFMLANKTLADLYGVAPEEMIGKSDADYNPDPEQVAKIHADDMEVIRTRQPKFIVEEPVTSTDGETRWYQTTKVPLILPDGDIQLLGVATDITARKGAEEQLQDLVIQEQDARQVAETASKMKDLFLANMSHELRTPLNALIGFLREMLYSNQLNQDNTHMAERSLANSKRLNIMVNSVLDLSRLAVGGLELVAFDINLADLVQYIYDDLAIQAKEKGLQFDLDIDPRLPTIVQHDEERLTQIISNLLINAIKYTKEGHIKLALSRGDSEQLIIEISDTGIGIPHDMQAYIFENFTQVNTKSSEQGVGLGLSIVKSLVDLMDGHIFLHSVPNKFTVFTVELPMNLPDH